MSPLQRQPDGTYRIRPHRLPWWATARGRWWRGLQLTLWVLSVVAVLASMAVLLGW